MIKKIIQRLKNVIWKKKGLEEEKKQEEIKGPKGK
jgi:hypothetical protein